ncbi:hypothetical protein DPX39_110023200 [Trypanosoma brucei equiperdum]|uniref:Uncharacterized protein n=1 Tax=Trypanosoma brucei equiperdum TaxID=630700 RepID=A0A3L6KSL3_9TRYP|nr:hypothetical protein DPX39_110023200 [Trypanosoma brucei equiperdum]
MAPEAAAKMISEDRTAPNGGKVSTDITGDYFFGRIFLRPYDVASLLAAFEGKMRHVSMEKQHSSLHLKPIPRWQGGEGGGFGAREGKSFPALPSAFALAGEVTAKVVTAGPKNTEDGSNLLDDEDEDDDAANAGGAATKYNLDDRRSFNATIEEENLVFVMKYLDAVLGDMFGIQHQYHARITNELLVKREMAIYALQQKKKVTTKKEHRYRSMEEVDETVAVEDSCGDSFSRKARGEGVSKMLMVRGERTAAAPVRASSLTRTPPKRFVGSTAGASAVGSAIAHAAVASAAASTFRMNSGRSSSDMEVETGADAFEATSGHAKDDDESSSAASSDDGSGSTARPTVTIAKPTIRTMMAAVTTNPLRVMMILLMTRVTVTVKVTVMITVTAVKKTAAMATTAVTRFPYTITILSMVTTMKMITAIKMARVRTAKMNATARALPCTVVGGMTVRVMMITPPLAATTLGMMMTTQETTLMTTLGMTMTMMMMMTTTMMMMNITNGSNEPRWLGGGGRTRGAFVVGGRLQFVSRCKGLLHYKYMGCLENFVC